MTQSEKQEYATSAHKSINNMGKLSEILKLDFSKNILEHASTYIYSKLKGYKVFVDTDRNIYVTKGDATYPAFLASVYSDFQDEDVIVDRITKNVWVGYEKTPLSVAPAEFAAGPKTAIYLALKLLDTLDNVKCVFKFNNTINKTFFDDCRWVLELNGKGNNEILTTYQTIPQCSTSFTTMVKTIGKKYGYDISGHGMPSVSNLELPISVVNIPNGHYAPYSGFHQVVEGDVAKAFNFCKDMAKMICAVCTIDDGCGTCGRRLTRTEEHFCYGCLTRLRQTKMFCTQCGGNLYTGKEFYARRCVMCK